MTDVLRYSAFTDRPDGGNPAGVVLDASGLSEEEMQAIAASVGYSETAFVTGASGADLDVRYFSPLAEVPFCGHATIATGVAWGETRGFGTLRLSTRSGLVEVEVAPGGGGGPAGDSPAATMATLTSVEPSVAAAADADVAEALAALDWAADELDPELPPRVAYAGAFHLVLAAATPERLAALDYDFDRLGALMAARDWTTVALVTRLGPDRFRARNPFPPGGVVEDPATGAAAAAFGAYLRELGVISPPAEIAIEQGVEMGRPSLLHVEIPPAPAGVRVSGTAVPIP